MAPGECPKCGGPNLVGATVCQWCGSALPAPTPAPPLPTLQFDDDYSVNPPDTAREGYDDDEGGFGRHPPPNLLGRLVLLGIIGLVIVVTFASQDPATSPTSPYSGLPGGGSGGTGSVFISEVVVTAAAGACGLNGANQADQTLAGGEYLELSWTLPVIGGVPCTVTNVSSETPGFTAIGNLPITVTGADLGASLNITVTTPDQYNGILELYFG